MTEEAGLKPSLMDRHVKEFTHTKQDGAKSKYDHVPML